MKLRLVVSIEAEQDIQEAFEWYEAQVPGLGDRLLASIDESFETISDFPEGFPIKKRSYRECVVNDFPYLIIYRIIEHQIVVYQLFHVKRRPSKKIK